MSISELTAKAKEYKELQRLADELAAEIEAIKDEIRTAMNGAEIVTAGCFKISNKPVTSSRLDTTAIKKDHPEIAAQYTKITTAPRFMIT